MRKKLIYVDMDGVVADFDKAIKKHCPDLHTANYHSTGNKVTEICVANPEIFHTLEPVLYAVEAVKYLDAHFDVYFLSTPMWEVPLSFAGKRVWLHDHFGTMAEKKLILTHRKDLNVGDFLIDDSLRNGVEDFVGTHIHFGSPLWPDWITVLDFFRKVKRRQSC